jgi:hypothetical protein
VRRPRPGPIVSGHSPQGSSQRFRLAARRPARQVVREPAEENAKGDRHELGRIVEQASHRELTPGSTSNAEADLIRAPSVPPGDYFPAHESESMRWDLSTLLFKRTTRTFWAVAVNPLGGSAPVYQ